MVYASLNYQPMAEVWFESRGRHGVLLAECLGSSPQLVSKGLNIKSKMQLQPPYGTEWSCTSDLNLQLER